MIYDGVLSTPARRSISAQMEHALAPAAGEEDQGDRAEPRARSRPAPSTRPSSCRSADPYCIERMDETAGMILVEGNAAAALGCMMAGVTVVAWYPITPSSSLPGDADRLHEEVPRSTRRRARRRSPSSRPRTRLPRIGMVIGAGWAGARAMTSTVGPGHLADGRVRRPGVLRRDPRRGLRHPAGRARRPACRRAPRRATSSRPRCCRTATPSTSCCIPASVEECYTMAMEAFDLAERFQTLVFVMSDLDLGDEHLDVASRSPIRRSRSIAARCSTQETLARTGRVGPLQGRRRRRHPVPHHSRRRHAGRTSRAAPATTTRGSTASGRTTTSHNMDRLARKFETARTARAAAEVDDVPGRAIGIIGYGTSHWAIVESRDQLERGERASDRLPAAARLSVHRGARRLHRPLRSRLRGRAEPRRPDAVS